MALVKWRNAELRPSWPPCPIGRSLPTHLSSSVRTWGGEGAHRRSEDKGWTTGHLGELPRPGGSFLFSFFARF